MPLPTPQRARLGAVQQSNQAPSQNVVTRRGPARGAADADWLVKYQDWQAWARRYTRQVGAAGFAANVTSDCCARCDVFVEERVDGDWVRSDDPKYDGLLDLYANELQSSDDLIRMHAHHYQVAGEMVQTQVDANGHVEYGIYSTAGVLWNAPLPGQATVKLVPDGKVDKGTAFVVPRAQVVRFWIPDPEWPAYAWSPMAASVEDLHRWRALARYAWRTADSALAMGGVLWAPEGPFAEVGVPDDDEDAMPGNPRRGLEEQYYEIARLSLGNTDDVAAIAPPLWHWDKEEGAPEFVKVGGGLDQSGIEHRREALEDFARGSNLPVTTVVGGGVGDANHWSEWLASDKFFDSAVAPTMNRICYLDLTRSFLWPRALLAGESEDRLPDLRIGYDPTPVIVKPDQSDAAIRLHSLGLLKAETTLEACGFDEDDRMDDPEEMQWLLEVLSKGTQGSIPGVEDEEPAAPAMPFGPGGQFPAGPQNVQQGPPERPTDPEAANQPPMERAAGVREPRPFDRARMGYSEDQEREDNGRFAGGGSDSSTDSRGGGAAGSIFDRLASGEGGFTINPVTGSIPTTGYIVAHLEGTDITPRDEFMASRDVAIDHIVSFMDANAEAFDTNPDLMIGVWNDTAHDEVVLDVVEQVEDRDAAIAFGQEQDQQEIYDVERDTTITTGGSGGRQSAAGRASGEAAEALVRDDRGGTSGVGRQDRGRPLAAPLTPDPERVRRAVRNITRLRQSLGTRLRAEAEQAYEHALRQAGVKLQSRARNRAGATRQAEVRIVVEERRAFAPLLAVVGLKEQELLLHAFDTFRERAAREIDRYTTRVEREVRRAGLDDSVVPKWNPMDAVEYLVAGLTAMARNRLMLGDDAAVQAAAPTMIPRAIRRAVDSGDLDLPGMPNPDELAAAAARLVRNAVAITENRGTLILPTTPDLLPTVTLNGEPIPEVTLFDEVGVRTMLRWEHGFYGEPLVPFEPHEDLGASNFTTDDPENDPDLVNPDEWPPVDAYEPGDHDGCTCEWIPVEWTGE